MADSQQTKSFELEIDGSTKTIEVLVNVNRAIADNVTEIKNLNKESGLTQKTINNLNTEQERLKKTNESLTIEIKKETDRMKELLNTHKQASKEYKELKTQKQINTEALTKNTKEIQKNQEAQDKHNKKLEASTKETVALIKENERLLLNKKDLTKQTKDEAKAFESLEKNIPTDSIKGLNAQYSKLLAEYSLLSKAERESAKGKELEKHLRSISDETLKANKAIGNIKAQIGSYDASIDKLKGGLKDMLLQHIGVNAILSLTEKGLRHIKDVVVEYDSAVAELGTSTAISGKELKKLSDIALESGGRFGTQAVEMLKIFELVANARPELKENIELLARVSAQVDLLSKAERVNAQIASSVVTDAAKKFNISLQRSSEIVDTLSTETENGKVNVEGLGDAIRVGGSLASSANISLKNYLDIIEAMGAVGGKPEDTANKLNRVFFILSKTTDEKLNPALHSVPEILETLDKRLGVTAGSTDALTKANDLFTSKSGAFVIELIKQRGAIEKLNEKEVQANNALLNAIKNNDTIKGSVKELGATFDTVILKGADNGTIFTETIKGAVQAFTLLVKTIGDPQLIKAASEGGALNIIAKNANQLLDEVLSEAAIADLAKKGDAVTEAIKNIGKALGNAFGDKTKSVDELRAELDLLEETLVSARQKGDKALESSTKKRIEEINKILNLGKDIESFGVGSLGAIDKSINDLNDRLSHTTSELARERLTRTITELTVQKERILATLKEIEDKTRADLNKATPETKALIKFNAPTGIENFIEPPKDKNFDPNAENRAEAKRLEEREQSFRDEESALIEHNDELNKIQEGWDKVSEENRKKHYDELLRQSEDYQLADIEATANYGILLADTFAEIGNALTEIATNNELTQKEAHKKLLQIILRAAEGAIRIEMIKANAIAAIAAATNPILLAKLAAQLALNQALVSAAFSVINGIVQSFSGGGKIKRVVSGEVVKGNAGEYYKPTGSKDSVLIHAFPDEAVINPEQQRFIQDRAGENIFADAGVKGFNSVPTTNNYIYNQNKADMLANLQDSQIMHLAESIAERTADAIITASTGNRILDRKRLRK